MKIIVKRTSKESEVDFGRLTAVINNVMIYSSSAVITLELILSRTQGPTIIRSVDFLENAIKTMVVTAAPTPANAISNVVQCVHDLPVVAMMSS